MSSTKTVLGLDLGTNSIGWVLIEEKDKKPIRVIDIGSRIFEQSVEGSIGDGRDEPKGAERREARQRRRQTNRRSMRRINTMRCLQNHDLLPSGEIKSGKQRQNLINDLDVELQKTFVEKDHSISDLTQLPYFLRARGLDHELPLHALGRAIYHLCQRRGFKSNRKESSKEDDSGQVKTDIAKLNAIMIEAKSRTLGEYFNSVSPHEERIRKRWTSRQMYEIEFELLWQAQAAFHPDTLTDELKKKLYGCIFDQRPLKSQKGLIGKCELEPTRKRAAWATLVAQRFRYVQRINDLRFKYADGTSEDLTQEQRNLLYAAMEDPVQLNAHHQLTFAAIKKILGLKPKSCTFNLEEGGEKNLPGNKTASRIQAIIGEKWSALFPSRQNDLVGELMGGASDERMKERAMEVWECTEDEAEALSDLRLEESHCSYSTRALNKLLPAMLEGTSFATAKLDAYGGGEWEQMAMDLLPPLETNRYPEDPDHPDKMRSVERQLSIRNPVVHRVLSQLRLVLNHIIREHGKPDMIRIELARDIKQPRKNRQEAVKRNRLLEKERDKAADYLRNNCGIQNPKRDDIEKFLLWEECNQECPYTGNKISRQALFGSSSQYDVEHIIPFSRSLDNSYLNKTLCYNEENRHVKMNKTPYETYSGNEEQWNAVVERVKRFKGDRADVKLTRFITEDLKEFEEFSTRHLNDTRYASKEAKKYVGLLYGEDANSCVQVSTGQLTAHLRNAWHLNNILNDGNIKTREDHRHHAVDAIVVAMINPAMTKIMSRASQQNIKEKGRIRGWWKLMKEPWVNFHQDCQKAIEGITVSHMLTRKVRGNLHKETNYSRPRVDEESGKKYVHIRKELDETFSAKDIENIIDEPIRDAVRAHFDYHGGTSKKAFPASTGKKDDIKPPSLNGIPIRRVRIRKNSDVTTIGHEENERHVVLGNNHHVEVIKFEDKNGNEKWDFVVVDLFDTMQRVKQGIPVVQRDHGEGKTFVMSLCKGDTVIMENTEDVKELYVVRNMKKSKQIFFKTHTDARLSKDIPDSGSSKTPRSALTSKLRKVVVGPLGKVYPARD